MTIQDKAGGTVDAAAVVVAVVIAVVVIVFVVVVAIAVVEIDVVVAAATALAVLAVAADGTPPPNSLKFLVYYQGGRPHHELQKAVWSEESDLSSEPLLVGCPGE